MSFSSRLNTSINRIIATLILIYKTKQPQITSYKLSVFVFYGCCLRGNIIYIYIYILQHFWLVFRWKLYIHMHAKNSNLITFCSILIAGKWRDRDIISHICTAASSTIVHVCTSSFFYCGFNSISLSWKPFDVNTFLGVHWNVSWLYILLRQVKITNYCMHHKSFFFFYLTAWWKQ